ncbi:MAG TPA: pyridoxal phosphate-dependent aminotransferase [Vicinamibacterales bacterium]|nr:pyridoxal phosphate-dependent aminotransferase [Vicinamibacterales bacterium]
MHIPSRILEIELPPFDPLNVRAAHLRAAGHEVISLGQALPFYPPPASAVRAAQAALERPGVHGYTTDPGRPELRRLLAERLRQHIGVECEPDDVMITAGANHAFTTALTTLISAGDEIVLPAPYFTNHQMAVQAAGAVAIEAPVADRDTYSVTWNDIAPALTDRTRAVVLCNPSNPTGAPVNAEAGTRIVSELAARGILVISDETYLHFVYDGNHWSAASVAGWRRNVVVIGTFSKSFAMMGWRVGYLLADAPVCTQATKVQDAMIICAPTISQIAAEAAVRDDWNYPLTFHAELLDRRARLSDGLGRIAGVSWMPTSAGFFAFVRVDGCTDSNQLALDLLEGAHIVAIPGASFGRSGEGCLRLSYGSVSGDGLVKAIERLTRFLG